MLNTQHYKVGIKDKVEQYTERSTVLPYTSVFLLMKRESSGNLQLWLPTLRLFYFDVIDVVVPMEQR